MTIDSNDPTLAEASAALALLESDTSGQAPSQPAPEAKPQASEDNQEQPTAPAAPEQVQSPETKPEQATTEKQSTDKPVEQTREQSRYARNQARLEGGWKELKERQEAFKKDQESYKQREADLTRRAAQLEKQQADLQKPKHPPEDYDKAAQDWRNESRRLQKQADELETKGEYDEADKLRAKTQELRRDAARAEEYAAELRANPPKTQADYDKELENQRKEWMSKAAIDFPETSKKETPEGQALLKFISETPGIMDDKGQLTDPKAFYYVARLVTAEVAAQKVAGMEKELGELRAKVKDFSSRLAPSGDGVAASNREPTFKEKSDSEQFAELEAMAQQIDGR